jgi:hypothetical protein
VTAWPVSSAIVSTPKNAAKMLLEGDVGFFGGAGWVGIDSLEKLLDLLLHLRVTQNGRAWLDLTVHFRLHSQVIPAAM